MAFLDTYRQLIENILMEYTNIPYAYSDIQTEAVFDHQHGRYLLVNVGWDNGRRIHSGLVLMDIVVSGNRTSFPKHQKVTTG